MSKTLTASAAVIIGAALALGGATVASAHTPSLSCTPSGVVHVELHSYPAGSTVTGTIGDTPVGPATFGPDAFTASEKVDLTVEHDYDITVVGSDGQGNEHWTGTTSALCGVPITPPATETPTPTPTATTPVETPTPTPTPTPVDVLEPHIQDYVTCKGAAFVLDNSGSTVVVQYTVAGKVFEVPAGAVVHTDADGFLFPADIGVYKITTYPGEKTWAFAPPTDCAVVTPPAETPAPTSTPEPTVPVTSPSPTAETTKPSVAPSGTPSSAVTSTAATATATPVADVTSTSTGELAYTGVDDFGLKVTGALALLLAGLGLLAAPRIRRHYRR